MFAIDKRLIKKHDESTLAYLGRVIIIPLLLIISAVWYFTHEYYYLPAYEWLADLAANSSYGLYKLIALSVFLFLLLCYLKFIRLDYGANQKTKGKYFYLYRYICFALEFVLVINTMCFLFGIIGYLRFSIVTTIYHLGWHFEEFTATAISHYLNEYFAGNNYTAGDVFLYYSFLPATIILLAYKLCYNSIRDMLFNRFNVRLSRKMQKRVNDNYKKENITMSDVDEEYKELEKVAKTKVFDPLKYVFDKDMYKLITKARSNNYTQLNLPERKLNSVSKLLADHFKSNGLLVGLNQNDEPAYISYDTWQTSHTSICGLTGRGKGVVSGCLLTQNIWLGFANIICDPKKNGGDQWLFYVMHEMLQCYNAIYGTNRKVHYINLNISEPQLNLLKGITKLEFKECLSAGFNLVMKDTDADHYRKNDIEQMEYLSELIDSVKSMPEYWENLYANHLDDLLNPSSKIKPEEKVYDDIVKNHISSFSRDLRSLALMPVLRTDEGIDLEAAILNGDVIYINGSSDSTNIKRLQKMLLHRCIQIVAKTANNKQRPHVTFFIDETTYFLSRPLKTAVSTIRDQRANFIFNYQGIDNLRDVSESDPSLDGAVIQSVILNNSGTTLVYKVNHEPTRQWAAKMTGEKIVNAVSKEIEGVSGDYGTIDASGKLKINPKKESKFHANVFGLLPKRVGVMFGDDPAQLIFTSPVGVEPDYDSRAITRYNTYKMKSYFFRLPSVDGEAPEDINNEPSDIEVSKANEVKSVINTRKVKTPNQANSTVKPKAFKPKTKKGETPEVEQDDLPSIHDIFDLFDDESEVNAVSNVAEKPTASNQKSINPKFPTKVKKAKK
ncbi:MAG: TraM recognition domain-containing protein [Proteobacteria bacterium]|nr:TraM recognition domain-containing protein [Pseudomonadota bacterium]